MNNPQPDDMRITNEAAEWLVELKASGPACHGEFFEWLRRSPEHVREFLAVTGLARKLKGVDPQHHINVAELLDNDDAQIVRLPPSNTPVFASAQTSITARMWRLAAGIAIVSLIGVLWFSLKPNVYVTQVGEQRSFSLSDGSLVHLNTHSKAKVDFSEHTREIELLAGEALFSVAHDAARPFRVKIGSAIVQAVGTQFNVYRHTNAETTVSVIEGAVVAGSTRLVAGEQANILPNGKVAKDAVPNIDNAVAWRQRQLVFSKTPLTEVAAQFNRYNRRQIKVDEQTAQERQITGVFAADRPESFLLFMERDEDIQVHRTEAGWIIKK